MESEVSAQSGQHDVGCTVTISITRPCSVIWMCSTRIPSGRESRDVPSIRASLLRENTRLDETISLPANLLLSKRAVSPKRPHEPRYAPDPPSFVRSCVLYRSQIMPHGPPLSHLSLHT